MGEFDPNVGFHDFVNILEFIVGTDLIDLLELHLESFLLQGCLQEGCF